jgi:hypothetical protein
VTSRHAELAASVAEQVDELRSHVDEAVTAHGDSEAGALRNVALVRYDAFTEMSGRMSFSLALLDDRGDGVTITAMTGQSDTRVYAKAVRDGEGEHELSPEERQAVSAARDSKRLRKAG